MSSACRSCRSGRCPARRVERDDRPERGREADARCRAGSAASLQRLRPALLPLGVTGQANAILLSPQLVAARAPQGQDQRPGSRAAGLSRRPARGARRRKRPRVERVQAVDVPRAELIRAHALVESMAAAGQPRVLAGDFNLRAEHLPSCRWSAHGPSIDHIVVAGVEHGALDGVAGGAAPAQWRGAVRPRPSRDEDRMTPEEARALFPVLERLAYLNAGTFGPLARPTAAAVQEQLDADLADGRFGKEYFERCSTCASRPGPRSPASSAPSRSRSRSQARRRTGATSSSPVSTWSRRTRS